MCHTLVRLREAAAFLQMMARFYVPGFQHILQAWQGSKHSSRGAVVEYIVVVVVFVEWHARK